MSMNFEKNTFDKRLKSMLAVDFRRMFTMSFYYIMLGISFVMPILILVMTTMMDGSVSVNPQTGVETTIEGFKSVWQIIGTASSDSSSMAMDITSMCNINMMYFLIAVIVCVFVSDDFRSGYAKNLFAVRANKTDYVISKLVIGFVSGASMLIAFFLGSMLGGAFAGLPFDLGSVSIVQVIMCMLSKIALVAIFVSIYLIASVFAKEKLWMSILLALGVGMLFFTMVPIITPLDSGIVNVILSTIGSGLFAWLFAFLARLIMTKIDLI